MEQVKFPHDKNKIIFNLYNNLNINTILNSNKLKKIRKKYIKYKIYCIHYDDNILKNKIIDLNKQCINLTQELKWDDICKKMTETKNTIDLIKSEHEFHIQIIQLLNTIIIKINNRIYELYKKYKKCNKCGKKDIITICNCKSNHKLCSECYDNKKCATYHEEMNTILCNICMEFNQELVQTGCTNNHTICQQCLDKIKNCPFCRENLNIHKETILIPIIIYSSTYEEREREIDREIDREREYNLYMIEYYHGD